MGERVADGALARRPGRLWRLLFSSMLLPLGLAVFLGSRDGRGPQTHARRSLLGGEPLAFASLQFAQANVADAHADQTNHFAISLPRTYSAIAACGPP
jgi:hypothetical protein